MESKLPLPCMTLPPASLMECLVSCKPHYEFIMGIMARLSGLAWAYRTDCNPTAWLCWPLPLAPREFSASVSLLFQLTG